MKRGSILVVCFVVALVGLVNLAYKGTTQEIARETIVTTPMQDSTTTKPVQNNAVVATPMQDSAIENSASNIGTIVQNKQTHSDSRTTKLVLTSIDSMVDDKGLDGAVGNNGTIELAILMYHNVIPDSQKPNKYEICLSQLEKDFEYIQQCGYQVVLPHDVIKYSQGKANLAKRCVMLTFDDGFYNYNKYLEKLLKKYKFKAVVSVVGSFTKLNKNTSATARYTYQDYEDVQQLNEGGSVEVASHSHNMHATSPRLGVKKKNGESRQEYMAIFNEDCAQLESELKTVGIQPQCYTYPYGAYCSESEEVVKNRGYSMSLTCNERLNIVGRNPKSLYLLGRYNRSGIADGAQKILTKAFGDKA